MGIFYAWSGMCDDLKKITLATLDNEENQR